MARISGVTEADAPDDVKELFERQKGVYGTVLNTTPIIALRPTILRGSNALSAGIDASGLIEPALRNLVYTKTGWINGCPF